MFTLIGLMLVLTAVYAVYSAAQGEFSLDKKTIKLGYLAFSLEMSFQKPLDLTLERQVRN